MFVRATGSPPLAATRYKGVVIFGAKTMTPSRFHVPPLPDGASHSVCGGPPVTSILFSLPSAKNPRLRLSGAQNGISAPSVAGSLWARHETGDWIPQVHPSHASRPARPH